MAADVFQRNLLYATVRQRSANSTMKGENMRELATAPLVESRQYFGGDGTLIPTYMPPVPSGHMLVCEFVRKDETSAYNRYFVCETLADMLDRYRHYLAGMARRIRWFTCPEE